MDDGHCVTLTTDEEGRKHLTARDADGKVLFKGPVDTEEQRESLPQEIRQKLKKLEGLEVETKPDGEKDEDQIVPHRRSSSAVF
jgi:hypothetical protein